MNNENCITQFEERVQAVLSHLPDTVGRARFAGIYISLKLADSLGYSRDEFRRRSSSDRNKLLPMIVKEISGEPEKWSETSKEWMSGYFFNGALVRMAAITEITLKVLSKYENQQISPSENYWNLSQWYSKTFNESLDYLNRTRAEMNYFKHGPRDNSPRKLETLSEGYHAFEELLILMEITASRCMIEK